MIPTFVSLQVPMQDSPVALRRAVETALQAQGEPLRWAITHVDASTQTVQVEAVILQSP
jgi:hypothetical protein